ASSVQRTVTSKMQVASFPDASVAAHLTIVVPMGKSEPEGGSQTIVGLGSTASVALTTNSTVAPSSLSHLTRRLCGQTISGGVTSPVLTTMDCGASTDR